MKMVKSLLLGSAAGLVALAGAQAADLPVKAKPVEYVKVCSLYGVGFYYIPGTDTCIKIGGYVRADYYYNAPGAFPASFPPSLTDANLRNQQNLDWRARVDISMDVRSQTAYGVLRSYFLAGWDANNTIGGPATTPRLTRAFIQFAGFTFGLAAVSFFDGFSPCGIMSNIVSFNCNGQGATGWLVAAYTASLGNGVSLSLSLEYPRAAGVYETGNPVGGIFANPAPGGLDPAGNQVPDLVANLRVTQAWGYAMVAAALHRVGTTYWGAANLNTTGGPSDAWGWAIQGSLFLNVPGIPGDQFGLGVYYGQGATQYVQTGTYTGFLYVPNNVNMAVATSVDAVYAAPGSLPGYAGGLQLTTSWAILAGYQHRWNNEWMTSIFGGYTNINYNATATALVCLFGNGTMRPQIVAGQLGCNPDHNIWSVGSRTQWSPVPNLSFALDVVYHRLNTASAGTVDASGVAPIAGRPAGPYVLANQNVWAWMFRVQRSFWP